MILFNYLRNLLNGLSGVEELKDKHSKEAPNYRNNT